MCMIDDGETCEIWKENDRKARKRHKCNCCCRQIMPGEMYLVHFSVFEGSACSEKMCQECEKDRDAFCQAHGGMLWQPGDLANRIVECISEGDEDSKQWQPMLDRIKGQRRLAREAHMQKGG